MVVGGGAGVGGVGVGFGRAGEGRVVVGLEGRGADRLAKDSPGPLVDPGQVGVKAVQEDGFGLGRGNMVESRPSAHLLLHLPIDAVGVCDLVGFATGGTVMWAAAPLRGVILCASGAALGLGGAGTVPVSVSLTPSAAAGEGVV